MKKLLLAFSGIVLTVQLNAQTELLTLAENKLHGPVRSVATNSNILEEKFGEWETGSVRWTETAEFNKEGLLTSSSRKESKFETSLHFSYNKKSQLTQWKKVYGQEKKKDKQSVRKYVYDDKGREIVLDFYGDDGALSWKEKKNYNENGLLKEVFTYNGDGTLALHSVYAYDNLKRLQSVTQKNSKKDIVKTTEFEYDEDGNRTGETTYDKFSNTKANTVWVYKNGIQLSETKTTTNSTRKRSEQREFNKAGYEISYSDLDNFSNKTVYTYDSHNNWITATVTFKNFERKNAGYRTVREIKYY